MVKQLVIYIILFFCLTQMLHSQEGGVVAFNIPIRNSLKFNKYIINPTFSFVREQNKYISFTNKREWVQFENAPQTFLFGYSGRLTENSGGSVGLFQQNYGVLSTFGGVLNYALNIVLDRDTNLTFGMNLGFYKSGINEGNVITNFPDPSLQNLPTNMLFTVNPGINYGTTFFDFGLSLNNLFQYNLKTSRIIEENPEQSIQVHAMYTGYVNSRGFFDGSRFSGLVRSEFKKEQTVISGIMMLTIPKGMWAQTGYNTLYGVSAGIGFNVSNQIAIEYNYEKEMGNLSTFGSSHEVTLAYKFDKRERYNYSDDDADDGALITPTKRSRSKVVKQNSSSSVKVDRKAIAEAKAVEKAKALEIANQKREARLKFAEEAKTKASVNEEARINLEQENKIKLAEEAKAKEVELARIKQVQEAKAKVVEETRIKLEQENKIKLAEEAKSKEVELARIKQVQDAEILLAQQAQAKSETEAKTKADEEARIKQIELDAMLISKTKDATTRSMEDLTKLTNNSKIEQQELLLRLGETLANKEKDLKDLKEENDLSDQGIFKAPKPFKSVSAENAELESLKGEIDNAINSQNLKISELERMYNERLKNVPSKTDETNVTYLRTIQELKSEQLQSVKLKESILTTLEEVKVATEIEKKHRIKRAAYDNEQDRYEKDRAALNVIKQNTQQSTIPPKAEDFDFGEERSDNIQIVKNVNNTENGYYLVLAVLDDVAKRDDFLTKAVASGQSDINFFYDVNTSKYYIYYDKFDDIQDAQKAMQAKGTKPLNSKMSMVKIEN